VNTTCNFCGKSFELKQSHFDRGSKFCGNECSHAFMRGENSPHWRGGDKEYPKSFNKDFKHMIRARDNYTCAVCKEYGNVVHHINYMKNDTVPENCITLCVGCHAKTNSNRKYWLEYFISIVCGENRI